MATIPRQNIISKNPKLQEDIERNLKLRDGALRILAVAANTIQRLDAAKTILVSNARLVVSMQQLQREKTNEANAAAEIDTGQIPTPPVKSINRSSVGGATLCLSDIRIPLLWKDTSLTPNASLTLNRLLDPGYQWASGTPNIYSAIPGRQQRPLSAVLSIATVGALAGGETAGEACSAFCIVRVDDQIRETRLLCEVHPGSADLEFDDVLTFENVHPDFECIIEIYGYQSSNGQGPNNFLRRRPQIDSISPANRNSVFLGTLTPEYTKDSKTGQRVSISSNNPPTDCSFTLVARYSAKMKDLGKKVNAHPLELLCPHNQGPSYSSVSGINSSLSSTSAFSTSEDVLPLFGPICFSLTARPDSVHKPVRSGLLWIRALSPSPRQEGLRLYSCELFNQRLYAKLLPPDGRTTWLSVKEGRDETDNVVGKMRPRNSTSKETRSSPNNWDLAIKVDPSTNVLDKEPVCRLTPLCPEALTLEESEFLQSRSPHLSQRSLSANPLNLTLSDEESQQGGRGNSNSYNQVTRMWSLDALESSNPLCLERQMVTLHIASSFCGDKEDEVVLEMAACNTLFLKGSSEIEDRESLKEWLIAIRQHIKEQVDWGVETFGHETYIPEATSLTKHGTIIRASNIPKIPTAALEVLNTHIYDEGAAPVTAL